MLRSPKSSGNSLIYFCQPDFLRWKGYCFERGFGAVKADVINPNFKNGRAEGRKSALQNRLAIWW